MGLANWVKRKLDLVSFFGICIFLLILSKHIHNVIVQGTTGTVLRIPSSMALDVLLCWQPLVLTSCPKLNYNEVVYLIDLGGRFRLPLPGSRL